MFAAELHGCGSGHFLGEGSAADPVPVDDCGDVPVVPDDVAVLHVAVCPPGRARRAVVLWSVVGVLGDESFAAAEQVSGGVVECSRSGFGCFEVPVCVCEGVVRGGDARPLWAGDRVEADVGASLVQVAVDVS